jgi:coenzyme PQQ precursor peptide PqqA
LPAKSDVALSEHSYSSFSLCPLPTEQQLDLGGVCPCYDLSTKVLLLKLTWCGSVIWQLHKENVMKWSTPKVIEVCIGMEINDYFPAEL